MYQLEFIDGKHHHLVGLFHSVEDIKDWLDQVPFITTYESEEQYTMEYKNIPDYAEIEWQGSIYPLTRHSFNDEGTIIVDWSYVATVKDHKGIVPGYTLIEGYMYENADVEDYIALRNKMKDELKDYYAVLGKTVFVDGLGTEDGEYITTEGGPIIHIDPMNVDTWEQSDNIEVFLKTFE